MLFKHRKAPDPALHGEYLRYGGRLPVKFQLKALTASAVIVFTVPMALLFIWCAVNGFGYEAVFLFEKIHPSGGFAVSASAGDFISKIPGIMIALFYTAADAFILSFAFGSLYNLLSSDNKKARK